MVRKVVLVYALEFNQVHKKHNIVYTKMELTEQKSNTEEEKTIQKKQYPFIIYISVTGVILSVYNYNYSFHTHVADNLYTRVYDFLH